MLRNHLWCWWALSATPGEDNRGCAGWGQTLKFIPRVWLKTNTYDVQWKFNIESSPDIILIATFNDFSEATVILPTRNYGFTAMKSTAKYASWWKGQPANIRWLSQPSEWFLMMKDVDFLAKTKELNVTELYHYLEETLKLMLEGCYSNARNFLKFVRTRITHFKAKLTIKYLRAFLPSHQLYFVKPPTILNQGYLIDHFHKLYIQLNKTISTLLQKNNYRGMLTFDYKPLRDNHLVLLVRSSCSRSEEGTLFASFSPYSLQRGDYSIICELWSEKEKGQWLHAAVELYKDNQAWDQSGPYSSDLTFHVGHVNSSFLVTNVTLWVNVHQFTEI